MSVSFSELPDDMLTMIYQYLTEFPDRYKFATLDHNNYQALRQSLREEISKFKPMKIFSTGKYKVIKYSELKKGIIFKNLDNKPNSLNRYRNIEIINDIILQLKNNNLIYFNKSLIENISFFDIITKKVEIILIDENVRKLIVKKENSIIVFIMYGGYNIESSGNIDFSSTITNIYLINNEILILDENNSAKLIKKSLEVENLEKNIENKTIYGYDEINGTKWYYYLYIKGDKKILLFIFDYNIAKLIYKNIDNRSINNIIEKLENRRLTKRIDWENIFV